MSDALRFLFYDQLGFLFFCFFPSPSQNRRLSFYPSGVPSWAQMADDALPLALCTFAGGWKASDEPETARAGDHVGGSNFALRRATKNTRQHVHRSKRNGRKKKNNKIRKSLNGSGLCKRLIADDTHVSPSTTVPSHRNQDFLKSAAERRRPTKGSQSRLRNETQGHVACCPAAALGADLARPSGQSTCGGAGDCAAR